MLKRTGIAAIVLAGIVGGGAAIAAPPAAEFVMKAGASDLYEEQSSKLVLGSTKDPKIKQYANMMITDHMKTTNGVKAAVRKSGMTPKPPMLDAEGKQNMTALKAATGTQRDQLYIQQQKTSHDKALALMQDYSSAGDNPNLKQAATTAVPIVQHHIEMLNSMPSM